jgi:hypothetical protein
MSPEDKRAFDARRIAPARDNCEFTGMSTLITEYNDLSQQKP